MRIPFHKVSSTENEVEAASRVIKSGWWTMGPVTFEFEKNFSHYVNSSHSIAVSSCTAALHLSLIAAGISPGDEVIIPSLTFIANAEVVNYLGAKPVLCDVKRSDSTIDPEEIEKKISQKTKAIIPVHYAGTVCDMESIRSTAGKYDLKIIDDAAHAVGSKHNSGSVGSLSDFTAFSFYATKPLSTGEGGMITTDSDEAAERLKKLRLHGITKEAWNRYLSGGSWRYNVSENGYKYNLTDIQSAIGIEQLKKQDDLKSKRKQIAEKYDEAFKSSGFFVPYENPDYSDSSCHLYVIRIKDLSKISRDEFISSLNEKGIGTSVHYIPLYRFSSFSSHNLNLEDFPNSEWIFERSISLPIYPDLTNDEVDYIITSVLSIAGK
jgi:dTDP-4-amino-4,6-dideoxygalactose transaminase